MARKVEVMQVNQGETIGIYVVRRAKLASPLAARQVKFMCLHCEQHSANPWFEVKQDGMFADHYQLITHCEICLQLSVYEFDIEVENETN